MLATGDAAGYAIPRSVLEAWRTGRWRSHGYPGFKLASNMVLDVYCDTFEDVVQVVAAGLVFGLVDDYKDWALGNIPLSSNGDVCSSLRVPFTTSQTHCRELSLAVPNIMALEARGA